jgi:hypothetical protein
MALVGEAPSGPGPVIDLLDIDEIVVVVPLLRTPVALLKGTQARNHRARAFRERDSLLPRLQRRVHILVLDVNGVVILAPFIHTAVGVDFRGDASNSVTIIVARRATQDSAPTGLGQERQSSISRRAKIARLV